MAQEPVITAHYRLHETELQTPLVHLQSRVAGRRRPDVAGASGKAAGLTPSWPTTVSGLRPHAHDGLSYASPFLRLSGAV